MKNTSVRNISLFFAVLGAGIYFLRPASQSPHSTAKPLEFADQSLLPLRSVASAPPAGAVAKPKSTGQTSATTAAPSKPISKAGSVSEKDKLVAELRANKECYITEKCNFPQTDSRSYSLAVSRKIASDLQAFHKNFAKAHPEEARALATEFAQNEDGFVQEAAIAILHDLPPTRESLRAVTQVVTDTTDPSIVTQAMEDLKRYVGRPEEAEVHKALGHVLSTGGMLTSQQASQGLLPFLNPQSVGYYQKVLKTLPPDSEVARNLRISLVEYQRMSTGG